ncbi:MAG: hypothetical protein ACRDV4_01150, partial [Acidimicrobiales bacterium]
MEMSCSSRQGGVRPASVWVINLVVLGVLPGRPRPSEDRLVPGTPPSRRGGYVVLTYLAAVPTSGHDVALEAAGAGVVVILALACHLFLSVSFDPARRRALAATRTAGSGGCTTAVP